MSIPVHCPECHSQFRVEDQHAGKKIRCPHCQGVVPVPNSTAPAPPQPAVRSVAPAARPAPPAAPRSAASGRSSQPARQDPAPRPGGRGSSSAPSSPRRARRASRDEFQSNEAEPAEDANYESYLDYADDPWNQSSGNSSRDTRRSAPASNVPPIAIGSVLGVVLVLGLGYVGIKMLRSDDTAATTAAVDSGPAPQPGAGTSNGVAGGAQNTTPAASTSQTTNAASPTPGFSSTTNATPNHPATAPAAPVATPAAGAASPAMPSNPVAGNPVVSNPAAVFGGGPIQPTAGGSSPAASGAVVASPGAPATTTQPDVPPPVVALPGAPSTAVPSAGSSDPAIIAATTSEQPIDELFARVEESIVRVNVSTPEGTGNGSGFVAHSSGIAVTNYHVVENATRAWVEFSNKERIPVDGYLYLNHKKDIAILKFDPTQRRSGLKSIPVAAEFPRKGVAVVAIGAPLGLDMSVTEGVVSAVRTVQELERNIGLRGHDGTWVQTTAAISPGNSGGPLMNKRGEVVAINTLTYTGDNAQALNFGISCGDINQAMKDLKANPMPVSPLSTPKYDISGVQDRSPGEDILDVSGKPEGQQRLAALEKLTIAFLPLTFEDPFDVVVSSVRSEARNVLRKLKIDEILINDEKSVLLILMTLENTGGKLTLFITAHILVQDDSSGRPQVLKLWEKTGEVGTTSRQAILQGTLSPNLAKKIDSFFAELRADVLAARKAQANPASPARPN